MRLSVQMRTWGQRVLPLMILRAFPSPRGSVQLCVSLRTALNDGISCPGPAGAGSWACRRCQDKCVWPSWAEESANKEGLGERGRRVKRSPGRAAGEIGVVPPLACGLGTGNVSAQGSAFSLRKQGAESKRSGSPSNRRPMAHGVTRQPAARDSEFPSTRVPLYIYRCVFLAVHFSSS